MSDLHPESVINKQVQPSLTIADMPDLLQRTDAGKRGAGAAIIKDGKMEIPPIGKSSNSNASSQLGENHLSEDHIKRLKGYNEAAGNGPRGDTQLSASALARSLEPRDLKNSPFRQFHDTSEVASAGDAVPRGRRAAGLYDHNETQWLKEI